MCKENENLFLVFEIRKLEQQIERLQMKLADKKLELAMKQNE